jgi:hypothetical protein
MHIQLQAAPAAAVRMDFDGLEVQPGAGGHRVALRYDTTPVGLPSGATVLLGGHLQVRDTRQRLLWLGDLTAEHLPVAEVSYPRGVTLSTTISDLQLLALENGRGGGDLMLLVDVRLTVAGAPTLQYPTNRGQDERRIAKEQWQRQAEQLGALLTVSFTVPLPLGDPDARRARMGQRLQDAQRALADGRAEDAVRSARLAIDLLDQLAPAATYDRNGKDPRGRDLPQRFAALRDAAHGLASGAHHDDLTTATFHYSFADAQAIVACVAALASRA